MLLLHTNRKQGTKSSMQQGFLFSGLWPRLVSTALRASMEKTKRPLTQAAVQSRP